MTYLLIFAPGMTRLRNPGLCSTATPAACRLSGRSRDVVAGDFLAPADTGAGGLPALDTTQEIRAPTECIGRYRASSRQR